MVPPKPTAPRKRNRKRKRRAASSSSSDDDSSSDSDVPQVQSVPKLPPVRVASKAPSSQEEETSSSEEESSEAESVRRGVAHQGPQASTIPPRRSPSPDPRPCPIPPFPGDSQDDELLKQRFRKFWMASVADAFSDDLGEIRKEPSLTTPRLALLIDSLAAGADLFAPASGSGEAGINEMDVAMGHP
ncbi:hypothetical protein FOMPIDRAFT_1025902 [Fomitopsis schrenkii]|uniref:Ribosome assembly protein 3 n=1 Tax=Fomitopsis schrenkii TaxID=2126942 RepID=S8F9A4_FOMSC|nr:hypothetical protein FOMPIDRAFT_1025902 [Fomitopsis schrenkii]